MSQSEMLGSRRASDLENALMGTACKVYEKNRVRANKARGREWWNDKNA